NNINNNDINNNKNDYLNVNSIHSFPALNQQSNVSESASLSPRRHTFTKQASATSTTSTIEFNRQYEEQNKFKSLPRSKKSDKKKFRSLSRYNSYKVTITRFKSIFSHNKNKHNENVND
ncbi:hypothetical protein U3516DRAFT_589436, partial [Neocallimastix sp. 'constans']